MCATLGSWLYFLGCYCQQTLAYDSSRCKQLLFTLSSHTLAGFERWANSCYLKDQASKEMSAGSSLARCSSAGDSHCLTSFFPSPVFLACISFLTTWNKCTETKQSGQNNCWLSVFCTHSNHRNNPALLPKKPPKQKPHSTLHIDFLRATGSIGGGWFDALPSYSARFLLKIYSYRVSLSLSLSLKVITGCRVKSIRTVYKTAHKV